MGGGDGAGKAYAALPREPAPRCQNVRDRYPLSRRHADALPDRLELGAGGGLVGLAVARGCRPDSRLVISDQAEMFSLMEHNIALNGLQDRARAMVLNWYDFPSRRMLPGWCHLLPLPAQVSWQRAAQDAPRTNTLTPGSRQG